MSKGKTVKVKIKKHFEVVAHKDSDIEPSKKGVGFLVNISSLLKGHRAKPSELDLVVFYLSKEQFKEVFDKINSFLE